MSNSQWRDDQSVGELALREHAKGMDALRTENAELSEEVWS